VSKPDFSKADFSKPNVAELALVRAKERDGKEAAELDAPATEVAVQRPAPAADVTQANVSREAAPDGMRPFASAERGYRSELPRPQLRPAVFSAKIEPVLDASPAAEAAPAPIAPTPAAAEATQFAPHRPVSPPLSASISNPILEQPIIEQLTIDQLQVDEPVIVEETALLSTAMSHEPAPLPQAVLQPMLPQARVEAYPAPVSGVAVEARPAEPRNETEPPRQRDASAILSGEADAAIARAFNSLSRTVLSENARTLEDLVREMLRPMLKAWLDDNLPPLVERLVRAEIERVARGRPV
jgi:cell pole-organizing protein PopZ